MTATASDDSYYVPQHNHDDDLIKVGSTGEFRSSLGWLCHYNVLWFRHGVVVGGFDAHWL
jgi:hypothetical protein